MIRRAAVPLGQEAGASPRWFEPMGSYMTRYGHSYPRLEAVGSIAYVIMTPLGGGNPLKGLTLLSGLRQRGVHAAHGRVCATLGEPLPHTILNEYGDWLMHAAYIGGSATDSADDWKAGTARPTLA